MRGPLGHIGYDEEGCGPFQERVDHTQFPPLGPPIPEQESAPTTTERTAYIGVNKPYTPPTVGKVISPIHLIFIFSIVVLILFAGCTWLAKANEKKFQHTMYRFSTMRRQRRSDRATAAAASNAPRRGARDEEDDDTVMVNRYEIVE